MNYKLYLRDSLLPYPTPSLINKLEKVPGSIVNPNLCIYSLTFPHDFSTPCSIYGRRNIELASFGSSIESSLEVLTFL